MSDAITPRDLAHELGVSPKRIRDYLRERWGAGHLHGARWELSEEQAQDVRSKFRV